MKKKLLVVVLALLIITVPGCFEKNSDNITNNPPEIHIQTTNNTEEFKGEIIPISWNATDSDNDELLIDIYVLDVSFNNSDWKTIITNNPNSGIYNWDTSDYYESKFRIRVVVTDGSDTSDDSIDINLIRRSRLGIIIDLPEENEIISGNYNITWIIRESSSRVYCTRITDTLKISYSSNNFTNETILFETNEILQGEYSYLWNTTEVENSNYYQMKIQFIGDNLMDGIYTSDYFSILN